MHVLKLYFKIIKDMKGTILMFTCIFLGVFAVVSSANAESSTPDIYKGMKVNIAYIDEDQSVLSKNMKSFVEENAKIISIGTSEEEQKDALYYKQVNAIVVIPKGFTASFEKGTPMELQIQQRPDDAVAGVVIQKMNSYLNTMRSYKKIYPQDSLEKLHTMVSETLGKKADVQIRSEHEQTSSVFRNGAYFNYLSYVIITIVIMVEGMTMLCIFKSEVMKRNMVSPMKSSSMNLQLIAGNLIFGIALWSAYMIMIAILNPSGFFTLEGVMMAGNAFLLTMMCVSLAFLLTAVFSRYVHAGDAINGVTNIVGLGSSFLGGAFVPQSLISEQVLMFSRFIPTYWYVKLNDMLVYGTAEIGDKIQQMFISYGVLILFTIAFLGIALAVMKSRKSQGVLIDTTNAK